MYPGDVGAPGGVVASVGGVKWTSRMAFDLALLLEGVGSDVERRDLLLGWCEEYGVGGVEGLGGLMGDVVFCEEVERYRGEVRDGGLSFRVKARVQAEGYLGVVHRMVNDEGVSAAVRADLIKWLARVGFGDVDASVSVGSGSQVVIDLSGRG